MAFIACVLEFLTRIAGTAHTKRSSAFGGCAANESTRCVAGRVVLEIQVRQYSVCLLQPAP
jgi:hypothetical protein